MVDAGENQHLRERIASALDDDHRAHGFTLGRVEHGEHRRMADLVIEALGVGDLLAFVQEAHDAAKATTDEQVREHAKAPASDPGSIDRFSYAQGLRDGVVMACEQILARGRTGDTDGT